MILLCGILRSLNHQCPNFLVIFHFMVLTLLWKMCFVIYVLAVRSRKQKPSQRRRKNSIIWWPLSAKFQVSSFKFCSQVSSFKFAPRFQGLLSGLKSQVLHSCKLPAQLPVFFSGLSAAEIPLEEDNCRIREAEHISLLCVSSLGSQIL